MLRSQKNAILSLGIEKQSVQHFSPVVTLLGVPFTECEPIVNLVGFRQIVFSPGVETLFFNIEHELDTILVIAADFPLISVDNVTIYWISVL